MIRQFSRCLPRQGALATPGLPPRRLVSTAPPAQRSRSWKSIGARWGLAIGAVYYYNTSNLFAEEAAFPIPAPSAAAEDTSLPTLDSITPARRKEAAPVEPERASIVAQSSNSASTTSISPPPPPAPQSAVATPETPLEDAEEEASEQGAFNEETGEINWDCPCLGGMAHGPCGEQFRAAFSCFVFSKEDPKGMDCIENFKIMQTCFRDHPDIYGGELEEEDQSDETEVSPPEGQPDAAVAAQNVASPVQPSASTQPAYMPSSDPGPSSPAAALPSVPDRNMTNDKASRAQRATEQVKQEHGEPLSESDELVPKAAHDAR